MLVQDATAVARFVRAMPCGSLFGLLGIALRLVYCPPRLRLNVRPATEPEAAARMVDVYFTVDGLHLCGHLVQLYGKARGTDLVHLWLASV